MAQLLWNITAAHARLILRVYFNIVLVILGFIGDQCCRKRVELQLLKKRPLDITNITGWLRGTTAALAMFSMRRSPAGWLGFLMVLAGLFWLLADLAVSGLVVTVSVPDRCWFNDTGLYEVMRDAPFNYSIVPLDVGNLRDLVIGAQVTSQANGGLQGIYHKVNGDLSFRADALDVIGQWNCSAVGQTISYPAYSNLTDVAYDLAYRGVLFGATFDPCWDQYPQSRDNHLVVWSTSVGDYTGETFDVRVAIDMSAEYYEDKVMQAFACSMHAPTVNWVLEQMLPAESINFWCPQLKGKLYENSLGVAPVPNPGSVVASILDAMVMIAGSTQDSPTSPAPVIDVPTQGCLAPKAQIPGSVIIIFVLVTAATLTIIFYWIYLELNLRSLGGLGDGSYDKPPNGLTDWMKQAVQETASGSQTRTKELSDWLLVRVPHEQHLRLVRKAMLLYEENQIPLRSRNDYTPAGIDTHPVEFQQDTKYFNSNVSQVDTEETGRPSYVKRKPLRSSM